VRAAAALFCLALTAPVPAAARDLLPLDYDPAVLWFEPPIFSSTGEGRVRLVHDGRVGTAALTVNQWYLYQLQYRQALAHFSYRMPVPRAQAHARAAAFRAVLLTYPGRVAISGADTIPVDALLGVPTPIL
jgi:hypothetical protein